MKGSRNYSSTYLHRMYLLQNPEIISAPETNMAEVEKLILKKAKSIRTAEDRALREFASTLMGEKISAKEGYAILLKLVESSGEANKVLMQAARNFWSQSKKSTSVTEEDAKKALENALRGIYKTESVAPEKQNIEKELERVTAALLKTTSEKDMRSYGPQHGYWMEHVISALISDKITKQLKDKNPKAHFEAIYTGKNTIKTGKSGLNVQSMADINLQIKIDEEDFNLPLSLKAKTISNKKEANILTYKPLDQLLTWGRVKGTEKEFLKTALIHQRYWGNNDYGNKVKDAYGGAIPQEIDPSGKTEYAIERLDYAKTIGVLRPAIDIMLKAFVLNLVLGFDKSEPNLFTFVAGGEKASGGVFRSSDALVSLGNNLGDKSKRAITFEGYSKAESTMKVDKTLAEDAWSNEYLNHNAWSNRVETSFDDVLSRVRIKTTLNYGRLLSDGKSKTK